MPRVNGKGLFISVTLLPSLNLIDKYFKVGNCSLMGGSYLPGLLWPSISLRRKEVRKSVYNPRRPNSAAALTGMT
jgi:hypothetical protein